MFSSKLRGWRHGPTAKPFNSGAQIPIFFGHGVDFVFGPHTHRHGQRRITFFSNGNRVEFLQWEHAVLPDEAERPIPPLPISTRSAATPEALLPPRAGSMVPSHGIYCNLILQTRLTPSAAPLFFFEFQDQAALVVPAVRASTVRQVHLIALRAAAQGRNGNGMVGAPLVTPGFGRFSLRYTHL